MDLWAQTSMKNAAKLEIYYETQQTTNHQNIERKRHWEHYAYR